MSESDNNNSNESRYARSQRSYQKIGQTLGKWYHKGGEFEKKAEEHWEKIEKGHTRSKAWNGAVKAAGVVGDLYQVTDTALKLFEKINKLMGNPDYAGTVDSKPLTPKQFRLMYVPNPATRVNLGEWVKDPDKSFNGSPFGYPGFSVSTSANFYAHIATNTVFQSLGPATFQTPNTWTQIANNWDATTKAKVQVTSGKAMIFSTGTSSAEAPGDDPSADWKGMVGTSGGALSPPTFDSSELKSLMLEHSSDSLNFFIKSTVGFSKTRLKLGMKPLPVPVLSIWKQLALMLYALIKKLQKIKKWVGRIKEILEMGPKFLEKGEQFLRSHKQSLLDIAEAADDAWSHLQEHREAYLLGAVAFIEVGGVAAAGIYSQHKAKSQAASESGGSGSGSGGGSKDPKPFKRKALELNDANTAMKLLSNSIDDIQKRMKEVEEANAKVEKEQEERHKKAKEQEEKDAEKREAEAAKREAKRDQLAEQLNNPNLSPDQREALRAQIEDIEEQQQRADKIDGWTDSLSHWREAMEDFLEPANQFIKKTENYLDQMEKFLTNRAFELAISLDKPKMFLVSKDDMKISSGDRLHSYAHKGFDFRSDEGGYTMHVEKPLQLRTSDHGEITANQSLTLEAGYGAELSGYGPVVVGSRKSNVEMLGEHVYVGTLTPNTSWRKHRQQLVGNASWDEGKQVATKKVHVLATDQVQLQAGGEKPKGEASKLELSTPFYLNADKDGKVTLHAKKGGLVRIQIGKFAIEMSEHDLSIGLSNSETATPGKAVFGVDQDGGMCMTNENATCSLDKSDGAALKLRGGSTKVILKKSGVKIDGSNIKIG